MNNIAYFLNVPWGWIKQRPHFIAEELANDFAVTVFETANFKKSVQQNSKTCSLKFKKLFRLPLQRNINILKINNLLYKMQLRNKLNKYNIIWLTHPVQISFIKDNIKDSLLIYDCMDDMLSFPTVDYKKYRYFKVNEKLLLDMADFVFCSSAYLKNMLEQRYNKDITKKSMIINNAITKELLNIRLVSTSYKSKDKYKHIVYLGTIAEWIDFQLICDSLEEFSDIVYDFYGPVRMEISIRNERIRFHGSVEYADISKVLMSADMLVMPFKVIDLVKSVNPVKLYEYIYTGIPSVAVSYKETEKFGDFVYLYNNKKEYYTLLDKLIKNELSSKQNYKNSIEFLQENTWDKRKDVINSKLNELIITRWN